jgi:AmmeMemoRadiSam system protein B/AmmeMemoRadiSam system protein A
MTWKRAWWPLLGLAVLAGTWGVAGADARVRESVLAGSWYPADPAELAREVDGFLAAAAGGPGEEPVRALVAPHAGYAFSGRTAGAAFAHVRGRAYRRVLVLAPSHHADFRGLSVAEVDAYATPLGLVPLDREAVATLRRSALVVSEPAAHRREHAIEIELPFLQRALAPGWRLVPVLVGALAGEDYHVLAELLRPLADEHTLVVVSTDFTHYGPRFGYLPFDPDERVAQRIRALDDGALAHVVARDGPALLAYRAQTGISVCGYRALALLLHLLPPDARVHRLAYATSAEVTGDWLSSVSYVALAVTAANPLSAAGALTRAERAPEVLGDGDLQRLHQLAALGVKRAVFGQSEALDREILAALADLPAPLRASGRAFVTLWRRGVLRGCMGYLLDDRPLYRVVVQNGVNAARSDHRFAPIGAGELVDLEVAISILSPPRPVASPEEIRLGEDGVILTNGEHHALFLPEVATRMGWDRAQTLAQLAQKAGLPADRWRQGSRLEVFTTAKYVALYSAAFPSSRVTADTGPEIALGRSR